MESQFGELKYVFTLTDEWFRPRDLWPSVLPANYLATETRPLGLLLLCLGAATFAMPNTYQIFGRYTNLGRLMLRSFLGTSDAGIPSNLLRELTPATVEAILRERRAEMARWVAENPAYPAAFDHAKAEWRQDRSR